MIDGVTGPDGGDALPIGFEITERHEGEATVIGVPGELDITRAAALEAALDRVVASGRRQVVLDLGECTVVDSRGLAAIFYGARALRRVGGNLRVVSAAPQTLTLLELANASAIIPTFESVPAALSRGPSLSP